MSYTILDTNGLLPGEPWTSAKALAVYENPVAIAAGDAGAPRVQGKALGGIVLGGFEVTFTFAGYNDLDGVSDLRFDFDIIGAANIVARFSNDNGATYGAEQTIKAATSADPGAGTHVVNVNIQTGVYSTIGGQLGYSGGTLTVPTNCNALQIRNSAGGRMDVLVYIIGGTT